MAAAPVEKSRRRLPVPVFEGLLPIGKGRVAPDIIAGATLAALAIPEVLGYSRIAGMPVITGLYTLLLPAVAFAVLGSSRHLVVGADSATAAITFAALTPLAATASPEYVALAGMLALMAAALLLIARVLRLGFLANFLSRTVLIGFLTGVGIQVACAQLAGMFGYAKVGHGTAEHVYNWAKDLGQTSPAALAVSVVVLLVVVLGDRFARKVPWALIAVVGAIVASAAFSLSTHGVATLGPIPRGLPGFSWPSIPVADFKKLVSPAISIFVVILAQSAATSRAYAARFGDTFDENVDLVGLGVANLCAGVTGTYVVNGSPTKTAIVVDAGGRSQLSQLTTAAIALLVLVFATRAISYLPEAVLAAVVFLIGLKLVDVKGMRTLWRQRPVEFWVAVVTMVTVVFVGVEQGILLAIALSIVAHLRHSYRPWNRLLVRFEGKVWKSLPPESDAQARRGLVIYRFGASLYYANAARFVEEVTDLAWRSPEPIRWFCLAMETVGDIDFTSSEALKRVIEGLQEHGITFVACDLQDPVRRELARDGLLALIGPERIFGDTDDVIKAYRLETGISDPPDDEIIEQAEALERPETYWWMPGGHRHQIE